MSRYLYYRLLLLLGIVLAASAQAHAQDDDSDLIDLDVKEVIEVQKNTDQANFLPVSDSAAQPKLFLRRWPDTLRRHFKDDPDFWYADSSFAKKKAPEAQEKSQSKNISGPPAWLKFVGWGIVLALFLAALLLFLRASQVRFARKSKRIRRDVEEMSLEEQLFELDFPNAITTAEAAQDWRLAVRLHYLSILREMAERNIIQYSEHYSNADYLRQVRNSSYYDGFFRITREYEYCWYGKLDPGSSGYQTIKKHYISFKSLFH